MPRLVRSLIVGALVVVMAGGCGGNKGSSVAGPGGGGGGGGGGGTGGGPLSAKINGTLWKADPLIAGQGATLFAPGAYIFTAIKMVSPTNSTFLTISLANIGGTGTYPLGVTSQVFGGTAQYGDAAGGWSTPLTGVAGTLTITTLTSTRIVGTFSFTATPIFGTATGTITVTEGQFDLPVLSNGTIGPLPDNAGSRVSATLDGEFWNGATAQAVYTSIGGINVLVVGGLNDFGNVSISLTGVNGAGTYTFSSNPSRFVQVTESPSGIAWGASIDLNTALTLDVGEVVITEFTSSRVKGTFSGTLAPSFGSAATTSMVVTNGEFDIGFP